MRELITGCMFAGKTSEMLRRMRRESIAGKATMLVCHASDTRYTSDGAVASHDGARVRAVKVECIKDAVKQMQAADIVFVDEAQFFSDLHELAAVPNVVAAGLLHQYTGQTFPHMMDTMDLWHNITFLHAVCSKCGSQYACRTQRTAPVGDSMVGGAESYTPVCAKCFISQQHG